MKTIKTSKCGKNIKINEYNKRYFTLEEMVCVLKERGLIVDKPKISIILHCHWIRSKLSELFKQLK